MSCIRVCFLVLLAFLGVAVQFAICENAIDCDLERPPGYDETRLLHTEKLVRKTLDSIDAMGNVIGTGIDKITDIGKGIGKGIGTFWDKLKNDAPKPKTVKTSFGNVLDKIQFAGISIFPGTLWCGGGDIAHDENDLGRFNDTDACCRAHDHCNNNIEAGGTQANLKNNGVFTRSACTCDFEFYNCLKKASSIISTNVGMTYFDLLSPQCFNCVCPTDDCKDDDKSNCKNHCKVYQWVDNPKFKQR